MTTFTSMISEFSNGIGDKIGIPQDSIETFRDELIKMIPKCKTSLLGSKQKAHKDPNAPKSPLKAFFIWLKENRTDIETEYFGDYKTITDWSIESKKEYYDSKTLTIPLNKDGEPVDGKPKLVALVTTKAGQIWKTMTSEDKEPFEIRFKEDQKEFLLKKESYIKPTTKLVVPEGWEGPFYNKTISKTIKNVDGKVYRITTSFDEAVELANTLELKCYGITQTNRGFQVRVGEIQDCEKSIASWNKINFTPLISKRGRPKKNVESEDIVSQTNLLSDSDDESLDVEELVINGITYLYDETNNDVYDKITELKIGVYENGSIIISN